MLALLPHRTFEATESKKEARVTHIVRDVKLLPSEAEPRAAAVNDQVREGVAVRTGDKSRSELTFADLTINRLGANSLFAFERAGRSVELNGGSVLLRVPRDSGGGSVRTRAVTVAITGTTLILETTSAGRNKLIMLEGSARLSLARNRRQPREVRLGQMLDVPAGATTLPLPVNIDLSQVMKTHPLLAGFPPLPNRDQLLAAARNQKPSDPNEPIYQGQPVPGSPVSFQPPIAGLQLPPFFPGRRQPAKSRDSNDRRRRPQRPTPAPTDQTKPNDSRVK